MESDSLDSDDLIDVIRLDLTFQGVFFVERNNHSSVELNTLSLVYEVPHHSVRVFTRDQVVSWTFVLHLTFSK